MDRSFLRSLAYNGKAQTAADDGSDPLEQYAFLGDGVVPATGDAVFEGKTVNAGSIESMHCVYPYAKPAVFTGVVTRPSCNTECNAPPTRLRDAKAVIRYSMA